MFRRYRRAMLRKQGLLPSRSKGRRVPFRTWDRAMKGILADFKMKQKSVKEQLEEEGKKDE